MKKYLSILAVFIFLLSGCESKTVYNKFKDLSPDIEWHRSLKVEFNPEIVDNSIPYEIYLTLNHHTSYPYKICSINLTQISPSGEKTTKNYSLNIKDANGALIGKGVGDYWDLEELIEDNFTFKEKGEYTFIAEHNMPNDRLTHVYRLGLKIKKIDTEK